MAVVVLCQVARSNDDATRKLFEEARLALPYSNAELLFVGDDVDGSDEQGQTLISLRFPTILAAREFRERVLRATGAGGTEPDMAFRLLKLRQPTIGELPPLLFP